MLVASPPRWAIQVQIVLIEGSADWNGELLSPLGNAATGLSRVPGAGIPQPQGFVMRAEGNAAAIWAERHQVHRIGLALKGDVDRRPPAANSVRGGL